MQDAVKLLYHGDIHQLKDELKSFNVRKVTSNHRDVYFELGNSLGLSYRIRTRELEFFAPASNRAAFKEKVFSDIGLDVGQINDWGEEAGAHLAQFFAVPAGSHANSDRWKPFQASLVSTLFVHSFEPGVIEVEGDFSDI
jgi:hypothetical protein